MLSAPSQAQGNTSQVLTIKGMRRCEIQSYQEDQEGLWSLEMRAELDTEAAGDFLGPMIETRAPLWPGLHLCDMDETLLTRAKGTGCRCSVTDGVLKCTLQNVEGEASGGLLACQVDR